MPTSRTSDVLDAAYVCFTRHGFRRTTMDDIAREVGVSRPTVYLSVRSKEEVLRLVADRLMTDVVESARTAMADHVDSAGRVVAVLEAKLGLAIRLHRDSGHARELLSENARLVGERTSSYTDALRRLLIEALNPAAPEGAVTEVVDILLALTYGLETQLDDPEVALKRLRRAADLIVSAIAREQPDHAPSGCSE